MEFLSHHRQPIQRRTLQRLRWYCQMCEKQCRDENCFRCHCMTESHQRQMEVFRQNPNCIVESTFQDHMKRSISQERKEAADSAKSTRSALEELVEEEERAMEQSNRKDYWLCEGIVVKVMSKALAENGYYKQKGVVRKVIDGYVGEIEMLESKHVVRVNQEELGIVLPQIGGLVKIVNGAYRGSNARFLGINTEKFCPKVQIEKGTYDGRVIQAIDYKDICQVL